jgi:spectinomycin phosphotransferase
MKSETTAIDRAALVRLVQAEYGLELTDLTFLPIGEEAYAYCGCNAGGRYFLRAQHRARVGDLAASYAVLPILQQHCDRAGALAPLPTQTGRLTIELGAFILALFPYIEGQTLWHQGATAADLAQAGEMLATLHACERLRTVLPPQTSLEHPFTPPIVEALAAAQEPVAGRHELQRQAAALLIAQSDDLHQTLARVETMQRERTKLISEWTPTHGDPNLDNFLKDRQGKLFLTDWGELALGPPERDLFAFCELGSDFDWVLRHYGALRPGVSLHEELFEYYQYRWVLQEIADYAPRVLFGDPADEDIVHAWTELQPYLPIRHEQLAAQGRQIQRSLAGARQNLL